MALAVVGAVVSTAGAPAASATGASLVRDINPGHDDSAPRHLTKVAGTLYFTAWVGGVNGYELWRSDGTRDGTRIVRDIQPGEKSSNPDGLTNVGGTLYFVADDGIHGYELWSSDGTGGGTRLVRDINPGPADSQPRILTNVAGTLYFTANDGTHGAALWRSDGTPSGTKLIRAIKPKSASYNPPASVGGTFFFLADDGTHGDELWRSNGTWRGTKLVRDINPGRADSVAHSLTKVGGRLFFYARDGIHGQELWRSDGTRKGTRLVRDINPGRRPSNNVSFRRFTNVAGILLFPADDGIHGYELWRSDGTRKGTRLVRDVNPGGIGSLLLNVDFVPYDPTNIGGTLYFPADDGVHGIEPWRSDGTRHGTKLLRDILPGGGLYGDSLPFGFTNIAGTLFFTADDGPHGYEPWRSDGTAAGTRLVDDLDPDSCSGQCAYWPANGYTNLGGTALFSAYGPPYGAELWKAVP
jgi:ELWxxDGT repeat protein